MTTFVNNDVQSGNIIYAADHNEQGARVAAVLNGGIDDSNLADASVTTAKIVDSSVTPAKMSGIDLFGVTAALSGTAPAALTGQFYIQSGSTVVTVDGNGNGLITFPTAFPSGVLSVICVNGDVNTITAGAAVGATNSVTAANFYAHANVASVGIRFNWIAIGF